MLEVAWGGPGGGYPRTDLVALQSGPTILRLSSNAGIFALWVPTSSSGPNPLNLTTPIIISDGDRLCLSHSLSNPVGLLISGVLMP